MNEKNPHGVPNPPPVNLRRDWKPALLLALIPIAVTGLLVLLTLLVYGGWGYTP